ncbi:MAG: nitroreductase family protein, partial [Spirochaetota bacterium]
SFNKFVPDAPVLIAVVTERVNLETRIGAFIKRRPWQLIDLGIAAEHFCLQAWEDGLGSCMIGWFSERAVRRALGVPRSRRIHLLIALGFSDDMRPRPKKRKPLDAVRSVDRY